MFRFYFLIWIILDYVCKCVLCFFLMVLNYEFINSYIECINLFRLSEFNVNGLEYSVTSNYFFIFIFYFITVWQSYLQPVAFSETYMSHSWSWWLHISSEVRWQNSIFCAGDRDSENLNMYDDCLNPLICWLVETRCWVNGFLIFAA